MTHYAHNIFHEEEGVDVDALQSALDSIYHRIDSSNTPFTGDVDFGSDGAGVDLTAFSTTAGRKLFWDASEDEFSYLRGSGASAEATSLVNFIAVDDDPIEVATPLVKVVVDYDLSSGSSGLAPLYLESTVTNQGQNTWTRGGLNVIFTDADSTAGTGVSVFPSAAYIELNTGDLTELTSGFLRRWKGIELVTTAPTFPGSGSSGTMEMRGLSITPFGAINTTWGGTSDVRLIDFAGPTIFTTAGTTNYAYIYGTAPAFNSGSGTRVFINDQTALDSLWTGNQVIDSDTKGLKLGADQDILLSSNAAGALIFTAGASDTDLTFTFTGTTNSGTMQWMEDEDYFKFSDDILVDSDEKLFFRDTALFINSSADGQLDIDADTEIELATATLDMNVTAADISGTLDVNGTLSVASTIAHIGDSNTSIMFLPDRITWNVGGSTAMDFNEGVTDVMTIGTGSDWEINMGTADGKWGVFGTSAVSQAAAYTRNATIVEDRTLLASASATTTNNNNVLAALIADLQSYGLLQ